MRSIITIALLSALFITFNSCKKTGSNGPKVYVPAYIKAVVPYIEGQSVSFSDGSGQVVNATVSITNKFQYSGACGNCPPPVNNEIITYTLNAGANKFMEFIVTTDTYIHLYLYSPLDSYQLIAGLSFSVDEGVSHLSCFAQRQACFPSITLNGKTFTNVTEITTMGGSSSVAKAYHTLNQGIVGFVHKNGKIYTVD